VCPFVPTFTLKPTAHPDLPRPRSKFGEQTTTRVACSGDRPKPGVRNPYLNPLLRPKGRRKSRFCFKPVSTRLRRGRSSHHDRAGFLVRGKRPLAYADLGTLRTVAGRSRPQVLGVSCLGRIELPNWSPVLGAHKSASSFRPTTSYSLTDVNVRNGYGAVHFTEDEVPRKSGQY